MVEVYSIADSLTERNPLVSVIIPAYNCECFVEQAVRSIMNQTYKNLEIIITDDCSSDSTFIILQKLASEDSRIQLIKNGQNLKIVKTLNNMIGLAKGKYIARMDADDISLPERIEKQVEFLESNPDYAMCGTNAWHIDENLNIKGRSCLPILFEDCKKFLRYFSAFYHPTVMLKSSVLKNHSYSDIFLYAEDYELWVRLMYVYNLKCANLKERLFYYRVFKNQSSFVNSEKQVEKVMKLFLNYNLITDFKSHINIFYRAKSENSELEKKYINIFIKDIKNFTLYVKLKIYEKIIFYMYKNKLCYLKLIFSPMFVSTVFFHFMRKI